MIVGGSKLGMSLLDRIKECNNAANLGEYLAFFTGGIRVGWLNGEFAAILAAYPEVFSFGPNWCFARLRAENL